MALIPYDLVGMKFRKMVQHVYELPENTAVRLVREATNKYDTNAVQVHEGENFLGYVAKHHNRKLADYMDKNPALEIIGHLRNCRMATPEVIIEAPIDSSRKLPDPQK